MVKKRIYFHFIMGSFVPFTPRGWCFYPVQYKESQYVITLRLFYSVKDNDDISFHTEYGIYRYDNKSVFLFGHKRGLIDSGVLPSIEIKEGTFLDVTDTTEAELNLHIKEILKSVFELYERKKEDKSKAREAEINFTAWDGKIN